jgi:hypothetical protein
VNAISRLRSGGSPASFFRTIPTAKRLKSDVLVVPRAEARELSPASPSPDRDELLRQVTALEHDLDGAAAQARDAEQVLERLEASQAEAAGRLALASRAKADLEQRRAELHEALRTAERDAAEDGYRQALAVRDKAAEEAGAAINRVLAAVENLDQARAALQGAWDEASKRGAKLPDASPGEPAVYVEEWARLEQLVRNKAEWQLERDLVDAAAMSSQGNAIQHLPAHLQQLARQRRRALLGVAPARAASEEQEKHSR